MRNMNGLTRAAATSAVAALALTACSAADEDSDATVTVMTHLYAMTYLAEAVGGEYADVTQLVPAGANSHTYELSPRQVADLESADIALITSGNTDAIDDAIAQAAPAQVVDIAKLIDLLPVSSRVSAEDHEEGHEDEHDHGDEDPHTWLSIEQMPVVIDALESAFIAVDPDNAEDYADNAAALRAEFVALNDEYTTGLARCETTAYVVTHPAFAYISAPYGLTQIGISGIDEDTEPSPARLREISEVIEEAGTQTIFFVNSSSPTVAEALSGELDLQVGVLSNLLSAEDDEDYLSIARDNLEQLRTALGCA